MAALCSMGRAARHTPQHSRNMQCCLMLIHRLGRAKKKKDTSTVLETKLPWPLLQLLQRPPSICVRISPLVGNIFNVRRIKCLAKTEVAGGRGVLEGPIFSHSFTAGVGTAHRVCVFTASHNTRRHKHQRKLPGSGLNLRKVYSVCSYTVCTETMEVLAQPSLKSK